MRQLQTYSSRQPHPRGSVLIFAIVLLSILAMLGTAFLLSVRQSSKASTSVLTNQQDEIAAKSGMEIALRTLRSNVLRYTICTDRAVYEPTSATYSVQPSTDAEVIANTAPTISPLAQFRGYDKTGVRGLLSLTDYNGDTWNYSGPHYTTEMLGGTRIPTGTQIPAGNSTAGTQFVSPLSMLHIEIGTELVIDTAPNDETVTVLDVDVGHTSFQANFTLTHTANVQIGVLDFARRNVVATGNGSVGDFYLPVANANIKELGHLSATAPRGEYYTWITDMDAKFYAVLQDWGVDNTNTFYAPTPSTIRQNVLTNLGVFVNAGDIAYLDSLSPSAVTNDSRYPVVRSNSELALNMPSTNGTAPSPAYEKSRNTLDTYITPYKDTADFALPLNLKFCKDWSSAINVNTAPLEVIAAALSQIPSDDSTTPLGLTAGNKAARLAQRIVSKRPFLCRMDFEDFLAAQILGTGGFSGDQTDASAGIANPDILPPDTDPMWTNDPTWWDANDPAPIVYMIYLNIGRRYGPGNTTFPTGTPAPAATDPTYAMWTLVQTPELTLSQFLEIPGVYDLHPKFHGANWPSSQKNRFRYFFGSVAERDQAIAEGSLLTAKEFNNVINSITTIYVNDDAQVGFPGDNVGPGATVITMGTDGAGHPKMNTTPQGDDVYDNPANPTKIITNPTGDGIAKTWTSLNRPSYYSYFADANLLESIWPEIDNAIFEYAKLHSNDATLHAAVSVFEPIISKIPITTGPYTGMTIGKVIGDMSTRTGALYQLKLFYELPITPGNPAPVPDAAHGWVPPTIDSVQHVTDIKCCRCRPYNSVYTDGRSGFYQMSFDDWTFTTPDTSYDYGTVQVHGDPEDTTGLYSTAKAPTLNNPITLGTPALGSTDGSGFKGNGDANWSPQFAFRSRYYGVYVLGRGLLQGATAPRSLGERRLEAVYDALKDEVLWQRSQLSDKRSLGD